MAEPFKEDVQSGVGRVGRQTSSRWRIAVLKNTQNNEQFQGKVDIDLKAFKKATYWCSSGEETYGDERIPSKFHQGGLQNAVV